MSADRGLEVVVPRGFDQRKVPELVAGRRAWIARAGARVEESRRRLREEPPRLPDRIVLPAVGEEWEVEYRPRPVPACGPAPSAPGVASPASAVPALRAGCPRAVARERADGHLSLTITGDCDDATACREALYGWVRRRARMVLMPRLAEVARLHGFEYGRVTVRCQRTRWASCSRRKAISLNARLLFLPPEVVDYVLLHELCHTLEMNHSPRFWALLESHDPQWRAHKKLLRTAGMALPTWLDHELKEPAI
jgi:predicted metal-dependent hydrolase